MSATHTTPTNRVAPYLGYDEPLAPEPQLPVGPVEKMGALSDTVFAALALLREQLRHPDPKLASKAAMSILAFEATRMRHGGRVAGTMLPEAVLPRCEPMEAVEEVRYPDPEPAKRPPMVEPTYNQMKIYVRDMLAKMQRAADKRGLGEVVSERQARHEVEKWLDREYPKECYPQYFYNYPPPPKGWPFPDDDT